MNVTAILNWIVAHHTDIINLVLGAAGLSVALEVFLTKLRVESKKVAFTLLHVFSIATALASFGLGVSGKEATGIYASVALAASWWHRFVVSDLNSNYVTPFLSWLSNQKDPAPAPVTATPPATVTVSTPQGTTSTTMSVAASAPVSPMIGASAGDAKPFTLDQPGK